MLDGLIMRKVLYKQTVAANGGGSYPFYLSKNIGFPEFISGLALTKDSLFLPDFSVILGRLWNGGIIMQLVKEQLRDWRDKKEETALEALGILHIFGGIVVILIGLFLAAIVFIVEKMGKKKKKIVT